RARRCNRGRRHDRAGLPGARHDGVARRRQLVASRSRGSLGATTAHRDTARRPTHDPGAGRADRRPRRRPSRARGSEPMTAARTEWRCWNVWDRQHNPVADVDAPAHHGRVRDPRIVIAVPQELQILDLAGPLAVFESANYRVPDASYRLHVVSATGDDARTHSGLPIVATTPIGSIRAPIDTLIVAGGNLRTVTRELVQQVRRLALGARRVASVCVGSFVLAEAGLLDDRRVTTHWESAGLMARRYPDLTVDADAIYIRDGDIWTSAGITAGIDLA